MKREEGEEKKKKTVLPSQIPKASLLKHSLPQGEREGEKEKKKQKRGEETEADSED